MKTQSDTISWVVVLMAISSLATMICLLQMDSIILNNLNRTNPTFSLQWAKPYWSWGRVAFVMSWFNLIAAITVQLYSISFKRKEVEQLVIDVQEELQDHKTVHYEEAEEKKTQELEATQSTEQTERSEDQKEPEPQIEEEDVLQPPETNEETPILPGVPEEETHLTTEETPPTIEEPLEQVLPGVS